MEEALQTLSFLFALYINTTRDTNYLDSIIMFKLLMEIQILIFILIKR